MPVIVFRFFVPTFLAAYALFAIYAAFHLSEEAVYPVYHWFVFSRVPPSVQKSFEMRIVHYGNHSFSPPVSFEKVEGLHWDEIINPPEVSRRTQDLGGSLAKGDARGIQQSRTQVEALFQGIPATYEVVEVIFNPVERFRNGAIIHAQTVATFTTP